MSDNRGFARISKILDENQSLAICLPVNHTIDGVAAATALYIGLAKLGKNPTLASSGIPSNTLNLKGVEKLQKELSSGGDNLVISFPYKEGVVDKITTNVEDNQFNLIIYPQKGSGKLDPSKVKYRFKGGSVDALFIIDVPTLQSLGELYTNNKDLFTGVDIINIDRHVTNKNFGSVNLVNKKISSLSELIFDLLIYLKVQIDKDIATNLYAGISAATNNFTSYSVQAATFEKVARLMKAGAVKKIGIVNARAGQGQVAPYQARSVYPPLGRQPGISGITGGSAQSLQQMYGPSGPSTQPIAVAPQSPYGVSPVGVSSPQPVRQIPMPVQRASSQEDVNGLQPNQTGQEVKKDVVPNPVPDESLDKASYDSAQSGQDEQPIDAVERKEGQKEAKSPTDWLKPKIFNKGGSGSGNLV